MKPLIALLAVLIVLATACQTTQINAPASKTTDPLAAADALLFSGHYDGAEAAYLKLAAENSLAKAHYVLLLDYENRFGEAVSQARAAATARSDSASLSRLTRALDWSEDVTGAVDAGSRAVKAAPIDPLAHVFYSEALADSARFGTARTELLAGEKVARDPYALAETEREWSNYYRGLGDNLEELNHLELSIRAQPDFPERTLELARYQYEQRRPAAAKALLDALAKKHSADYGVNVAIGDSASLHQDITVAQAAYQAALKVRPNGPAASLGLAELEVTLKRDFSGAHDLVLASFKANTGSTDVYRYLYYLDLLVLKTDPVKELGPAPTDATNSLVAARGLALDRVNGFRKGVGLTPVAESASLADAALAHVYFWLFNYGQAAVADVRIHDEDPSLPGAVGIDSLARAQHFGYAGQRTAEDISHSYLPNAAVDHWIDSVLHRYLISDPEAISAGYGEAQVGALSIQVLDLGQAAASKHDPVVYPAPDQANVPNAFLGNEIPDPAPSARYPTGYPITIQVGAASTLSVQSGQMLGPDGKTIPAYTLDPAQLKAFQWGVLPQDPLTPGGKYTIQLSGTVDGQPFQKAWSFTVAAS
jgi:uncharacterized protein YkwD